ncbi:hypothetical protein GCM10022419_020040 [Nonomuraea rosea]|uniref:Uncharacterized protein n=1 Tax=Nonomuraea rosea TaxID=638574 RepID=A0ABP6VUH0_9ACTN
MPLTRQFAPLTRPVLWNGVLDASQTRMGLHALRRPARPPDISPACSWPPTMSACSVCPQVVQEKSAWLSRLFPSTTPQAGAGQVCEVYGAGTLAMTVPVQRALDRNAISNPYQPLSRIALFRPDFAARPLRRNAPGRPGSGLGRAALVMFAVCRSSRTTTP